MTMGHTSARSFKMKEAGLVKWLSQSRHLPHKPDSLCSIPRTHTKAERISSIKLSSDLHIHAPVQVCTYTQTVHTIIKD